VCHCWLVQQWAPDTSFALLGKLAAAPGEHCENTQIPGEFKVFANSPPESVAWAVARV
jgi:hypothetical protein